MSTTVPVSSGNRIIVEPSGSEDSGYTLQELDVNGNWINSGGAADFVKAIAERNLILFPTDPGADDDDMESEEHDQPFIVEGSAIYP